MVQSCNGIGLRGNHSARWGKRLMKSWCENKRQYGTIGILFLMSFSFLGTARDNKSGRRTVPTDRYVHQAHAEDTIGQDSTGTTKREMEQLQIQMQQLQTALAQQEERMALQEQRHQTERAAD